MRKRICRYYTKKREMGTEVACCNYLSVMNIAQIELIWARHLGDGI